MPELALNRMNFIDQLHEAFLVKKGYGAFAFMSPSDALLLFNQFSDSDQSADLFIGRFMHSF